tara:strand:- start:7200 stop:8384 length:1185 start_codon:yes stop_codon:yes gene_type:complete
MVVLFVMILYSPRIVLFRIPEISSILRVDTVLTFILGAVGIIYMMRDKYPKRFYLIIIYIVLALSSTIFGFSIFLASSLLYISLFMSYMIGNKVISYYGSKKVWNFILKFVAFNCIVHLFSIFTGLSYNDGIENIGGDSGYIIILGKFGILSAPYNFVVVVGLTWLINFYITKKILSPISLLLIFSLILSESRSGFGILILILVFELFIFGKIKNKIYSFFTFIPILIFLFTGVITIKALSVFQNLDLFNDPSILMRLLNFESWIDWLTIKKLFFGGGAQMFLEFSTQYGYPGPTDVLLLRVLSEVGLVGLVLIFYFIIFNKNKKLKKNKLTRVFYYCVFWMFLLGFFNESMMSIKGGQYFWFLLGLLKSDFKIENFNFIGFLKKDKPLYKLNI